MSLKSEIAPKGLEFRPSDFRISDKYATLISIVSYPKYITPGYLSQLTTMPGVKIIAKHIPVPYTTVTKMLNKQIIDLKQKHKEESWQEK